ncbi:hypothetical protein OIO90_005368 [Microbotryomycetes sp. JL221]|nr:hypothetical protein OIO90_005368 [Microbotryomycetes sp. JL221]
MFAARQTQALFRRTFHSSPLRQAGSTTASAQQTPFQKLWKIWYEPAAIPIYVIIGASCAGAGWYLTRLIRHPDVILDRHNNPTPWLNVEQGTNTKLYSVNQKFDKSYSRDRW